MSDNIKGLLVVLGGVAALFFLLPKLLHLIGFMLGLWQIIVGLFWLALILAAVAFVIGLVRRITRY